MNLSKPEQTSEFKAAKDMEWFFGQGGKYFN